MTKVGSSVAMANTIRVLINILMFVQFVLSIRVPLRRVAREAESTLEVPLSLSHINWDYYGDITVGTAREGENDQVFSVVFDTGSQHLWIASADATNEEDQKSDPFAKFDSSKSVTFKKREEPFEIGYVDGMNVKGHLAEDTLKIVMKKKVAVLKNQVFGLAEYVNKRNIDRDGVFGLGLMQQTLEGNPDPPFITMTKQNGMEPVFGFYFNRDIDGLNSGEVNFGGEDEDLVEGEFTYHNVLKINGLYQHWYLTIKKVKINYMKYTKNNVVDHELQFLNMRTLLDTGCNMISVPQVIFDVMVQNIFKYASFEVSKDYQFSCSVNWFVLPDVTLVIDNSEYVMTPEDYVWGHKYSYNAICRLVFNGSPEKDHFSIGQPFMERYYTQFDMGRKRIGIARAKTPY